MKNRVEQYSHSNSFGMNFGATLSFGMTPGLINGMMATPVIRNGKGYSIEENLSKSGIYAKEKTVRIGNVIKITPTLRNEGKISVFDIAPISSIGSMMSGVQGVQDLYSCVHRGVSIVDADADYEAISDAFEEYIQRENANKKNEAVDEELVIKTKTETELLQEAGENSVVSLGVEALIDDLSTPINVDNLRFLSQAYFENTRKNQTIERPSSPEPVETALRKADVAIADTMREISENISDPQRMPEPILGADSDPQQAIALAKGISTAVSALSKPFTEYVLDPALKFLGTWTRRGLRDGCGVSQGLAQDVGDITTITAGILLPGTTTKVISNGGKLTSFGKAAAELQKLDKVMKVPYNPRAFETLLQQNYGVENVVSSTMPKANAKNVSLAGRGKVFTIGSDELTGQSIVKHIPINDRGLPVFDDVAKADLMIPENIAKIKNRNKHFKSATIELKRLIDKGIINKNIFNAAQMNAISNEAIRIPGFTWHHHENFRRLQLVPRETHEKTGHFGGFDLWFK